MTRFCRRIPISNNMNAPNGWQAFQSEWVKVELKRRILKWLNEERDLDNIVVCTLIGDVQMHYSWRYV